MASEIQTVERGGMVPVAIIHLYQKSPAAINRILGRLLAAQGFGLVDHEPLPAAGPASWSPCAARAKSGLVYLVSPRRGRWVSILQAHEDAESKPWISDLARAMSHELNTYALSLLLHEDEIFFYNLDHQGAPLDGYNSCPQLFARRRLSEDAIEDQRHYPFVFQSLLPAGVQVVDLQAVLKDGWWNAFEAGQLDDHGLADQEDDVDEANRMKRFGTLLQLWGDETYPFAEWRDSELPWSEFHGYTFERRSPRRPLTLA